MSFEQLRQELEGCQALVSGIARGHPGFPFQSGVSAGESIAHFRPLQHKGTTVEDQVAALQNRAFISKADGILVFDVFYPRSTASFPESRRRASELDGPQNPIPATSSDAISERVGRQNQPETFAATFVIAVPIMRKARQKKTGVARWRRPLHLPASARTLSVNSWSCGKRRSFERTPSIKTTEQIFLC